MPTSQDADKKERVWIYDAMKKKIKGGADMLRLVQFFGSAEIKAILKG